MSRVARSASEFDVFIHKTPTCWLWTGTTSTDGHGVWAFANTVHPAHRFSLGMRVAVRSLEWDDGHPSLCTRSAHTTQ